MDITETKTVNYETMAEQAELEAEADKVASPGRETLEDAPGDGMDGEDKFRVEFFQEYEFDNGIEVKKIKSVDLSGLLDLTTIDAERFDRILVKTGHRPPNKFTDTTYCKHVAAHVTKLPVDFFNMLNMRDMLLVMGTVHNYFLFG
ncbi:MAG: hypothetical protein K1W06_11305 [Lachnospiraceae bacterium]